MNQIRSISQLLIDYRATLTGGSVRVADILDAFHERGFGVVMLIFALPMALPIPVPPGVNIALAAPLLFLTSQQMVGRRNVWLPHRVRAKTISADKLSNMLEGMISFLQKLEALTRPRMGVLTSSGAQKVTGFLGFIMALTVCIPLPLTNTVPSFGIAIMALGVLMRDGLAVLIGAIIGSAWVAMLFGALILFGPDGIEMIKDAIKSLF